MAECDESEQVQSESSACWELRQIIRDAPFPLKDQNDAAEELERLAEQSDLHAQYLMGLLYRDGLLLIPDSQSAKYWLTQAAKQGLPEAQYALDKLLSLTILKSVIRTGASAAGKKQLGTGTTLPPTGWARSISAARLCQKMQSESQSASPSQRRRETSMPSICWESCI